LQEKRFPGKNIHTEISPLRFAPVEMTKERVVMDRRSHGPAGPPKKQKMARTSVEFVFDRAEVKGTVVADLPTTFRFVANEQIRFPLGLLS
jgi:hypothetical protein